MSSRTKTDNAHLKWKIELRKQAVKDLGPLRVLDLFAGNNILWSNFERERYYGIEVIPGKGKNLHSDNLRVIPSLDLSQFNVIDSDSYGSSVKQIEALFKNPTLKPGTVVLFTEIHAARNFMPKELVETAGIKEIYSIIPSAFQSYAWEYFMEFLYNKGIRKIRFYNVNTNYYKFYGYFVVPDSSKCAYD